MKLKTETVYVTSDGRQHNDRAKAENHERGLFKVWLKDETSGWKLSEFIEDGRKQEPQTHRERLAVIEDLFNFTREL